MSLVNTIRNSLRIISEEFDDEIKELIDQAIQDMKNSGVKAAVFPDFGSNAWAYTIPDSNIRRTIMLFVKANFGIENTDKDWYMEQYFNKKAEILNQTSIYTAE
jgi:hypothetical protein